MQGRVTEKSDKSNIVFSQTMSLVAHLVRRLLESTPLAARLRIVSRETVRKFTTQQRQRHARLRHRQVKRWRKAAHVAYAHRDKTAAYLALAVENGWTVLSAPRDLSWDDRNLERLCSYLDRIRTEVLHHERQVVVDLSTCERLSSVACLMLAAEVQRCIELKPGNINGLDPRSKRAKGLLYGLGFHEHLKTQRQNLAERPVGAIQIRSGLGTDHTIAEDAHQVSEVANSVFPDGNFARRVHSALNEALGNVQMWAYGDSDPDACLMGRWWLAGLANHGDSEAYFFALDHGVGIPNTAPKTMPEALQQRFADLLSVVGINGARDHEILTAVVEERRTKSGKSQHGKGIASMIALTELADMGNFEIYSGRGRYSLAAAADAEPQASSEPLRYTFPGTLLIWRVRGEKKPELGSL